MTEDHDEKILKVEGKIRKFKRYQLDLSGMGLTDKEMPKLAALLNADPEITSVDLSNNRIGNESAKLLAGNTFLTELDIFMTDIHNEGQDSIKAMLERNRSTILAESRQTSFVDRTQKPGILEIGG